MVAVTIASSSPVIVTSPVVALIDTLLLLLIMSYDIVPAPALTVGTWRYVPIVVYTSTDCSANTKSRGLQTISIIYIASSAQ